MGKYGIATIFENSAVGYEFSADNIPLHLSLIDSFEIAISLTEITAKINNLFVNQLPFQVSITKDAFYGPAQDIPVSELELTPNLANFHQSILALLLAAGASIKNPQFQGDGYRPHVSIYGDRRVTVGAILKISQVSIAAKVSDAQDAKTKILATISF